MSNKGTGRGPLGAIEMNVCRVKGSDFFRVYLSVNVSVRVRVCVVLQRHMDMAMHLQRGLVN